MVAFGLISVAEAEEFNVIVATPVPLVTAAISTTPGPREAAMSDHRLISVIAFRGRRRQRLAPQANRAHLDAKQFVALGIGLTGALRGHTAMAASRTTYKKYQFMLGNRNVQTGITKDLDHREAEHWRREGWEPATSSRSACAPRPKRPRSRNTNSAGRASRPERNTTLPAA